MKDMTGQQVYYTVALVELSGSAPSFCQRHRLLSPPMTQCRDRLLGNGARNNVSRYCLLSRNPTLLWHANRQTCLAPFTPPTPNNKRPPSRKVGCNCY